MSYLTNPQEAFKFVSFLTEALPVIDCKTPTHINSGGCGVFAAILYDAFKDLGFEPKIHALYFHKESNTAEKNLVEFIKHGRNVESAGEDHIVIELNGLYFDSDGLVTMPVLMSRSNFEITREQLQTLIDKGDWNPVFDRELTPFITQSLKEAIELYTNGLYIPGIFTKTLTGKKIKLSDNTIKAIKKIRKEEGSMIPDVLARIFGIKFNSNSDKGGI